MSAIECLVIAVMAALLAALLWIAVDAFTAETVELRLDQWRCDLSETYEYTTYISVGKVMVPQLHTGRRCSRWVRL